MKPYIEKNDGVPDNNRYSEALEAAKETVEALNKLTDQALAQYTALVDSAVAGHITDERELEHIMDDEKSYRLIDELFQMLQDVETDDEDGATGMVQRAWYL